MYGVAILIVGIVIGNANDSYRILGEKADKAATKGDFTSLRKDVQAALALKGQVDRNTRDIGGLDSRQRSITQTQQMLCGLHGKLCPVQNALWYPPRPWPLLPADYVIRAAIVKEPVRVATLTMSGPRGLGAGGG
ncbi:hypothetical protein T31B1_19507 [Salinisphaera sp. T31B1]